ncbi:Crp/Fnr family transcriptional regulator [Cytobacillus kochii]|uniref:Crp/Fnr family transcriptional regulator n=1 Tax=Cytobacillus kochii TaxID=859143 RepID=UPI0036D42F82
MELLITSEYSWNDYLKYGKRLFYKKNSIIFQQGDVRNGFYYLFKGIIKITSTNSRNDKRILDIVGQGDLVGDTDSKPYFSSAVCHEDCILYFFSKDDYEKLIYQHPETTALFFQSLFQKQRSLLNNLNASSTGTEYQIAYSLLHLINIYKGTDINLTQQELSQYVGLSRITIYKILKNWSSEHIIELYNKKISIKNIELLKKKLLY